MRKLFLLPAILLILFSAGCNRNNCGCSTAKNVYTIAVMSDIHYMDPSLLIKDGPKFQDYLVINGKLLAASDAIMQEAVYELIHATPKPDLVLIVGDLTKDGEFVGHVSVHLYLQQLIRAGIRVRVIDGNHDIYSAQSYEYNDKVMTRVQNISPDQFRSIYSDCGYSDAICTDPYSLSYVSEPLPNLWLISIDDCKYDNINNQAYTAGVIRPGTMKWILDRMAEAALKGKTVFGMMHHGLVEHFKGQNSTFPGFLVDNYNDVADQLMRAGLKIMFTGHFHATDIVKKNLQNRFLYDIETGSTIVYPCSYRVITYVRDSALIINTRHITNVCYTGMLPGQSFVTYADSLTRIAADTLLTTLLNKYKLTGDTATSWHAGHCQGAALMAHMAGDEKRAFEDTALNKQIATKYGPSWLPLYCDCLWTDLKPADDSLTILLKSGNCFKRK